MKKTIFIVLLYFTGCLLIPCLVNLAIGDKEKGTVEAAGNMSYGDVDGEDYVLRTVASYYVEGDNAEFLKALAIVVRTYESMGGSKEFTPQTLTYNELRAKWGDYYAANLEAVSVAVNETKGVVMEAKEVTLLPYFCELSAGYTRAKENSCLASVSCNEDLNATNYMTVVSYSYGEVANQLEVSEDISEAFQVISRDEAGYVDNLMVGNLTLSGDELARKLKLNSSNFIVTNNEEGMIFTVKGKGLGYGMSLHTARQKALQGSGYRELLFYFYKNISLNE